MTTPELLKPVRAESVARSEIAANDRRSWFPGTRALGEYGIISNKDSREVARCVLRTDRDNLVAMARSFDDMRAALVMVRAYMDISLGSPDWTGPNPYEVIDAALLKSSGVRP